MKGSPYRVLQPINTIVLAAGHGGKDPGATKPPHTEAAEVITITGLIAATLTKHLPAGSVIVAPHAQDTHDSIPWLNARYTSLSSAWALEIHRDYADTVKGEDASFRCGVYSGNTQASHDVALFMAAIMKGAGAHPNTWARKHSESPHKSLAWISQPRCLSHLIELGFMQGAHTTAHLQRLAGIAAAGIYAAFTGERLPV